MNELKGKIAVVTGAASGIGRALATRFLAEGMKVVLADVEEPALARTAAELAAHGTVLAVPTDVAKAAAVDALAARCLSEFGAVHVVCNNAGVGGRGGPIWLLSEADWAWTMGVNLWGVIHGIRAFVPHLLAGGEGHIVNTASIAGLLTPPMIAPYVATKHAVVALTEVLAKDLEAIGAKVRASVLCPGFVKTNIAESDRNRPAEYGRTPPGPDPAIIAVRSLVDHGSPPSMVADAVVDAIREERFYVFPHPELLPALKARATDILEGRSPRFDPTIFSPPSS